MRDTHKRLTASIFATPNAALVLADGSVFFGHGIGKQQTVTAEICFNTSLTGYQEILTDPSYAGQIITFTFPHIGNVGANSDDNESIAPAAKGLIVREAITEDSNYRSEHHLNDWLIDNNLTGITGVDTRALTVHIRTHGAQNATICYADSLDDIQLDELKSLTAEHPSLKGMELAGDVTCTSTHEWTEKLWDQSAGHTTNNRYDHHIVAMDFGVKHNILRHFASRQCKVTVVPATTKADDILALNPDGIFLSNGPGDPAATGEYAIPTIQTLVDSGIPIFGICLGHQMLALSQGCKTEKMHQGHRGANHPVQDVRTGKVEITSQNHGFVVSQQNLPDAVEVTHISLFDKTIQGIALKHAPAFSVQGHPEASPGPHDSAYLFDEFIAAVKKYRKAA